MDEFDQLEEKIKKARQSTEKPEDTMAANKNEGLQIASEFLGYVICGIFLGFMADKYIGTAPFGIIIMPILGLIGGVYRANQAQNSRDKKS